jgi:hypothetical protein
MWAGIFAGGNLPGVLCIDIPREPIWKCCPRYVANHVQRRRCRDCWLRNYRLREHLKIPRERTPGSPCPALCVSAGGDHWGECCVIYRRGELSKHIIDPDWPHQIALPAYRCTGANYVTIHLFCQDLTLCPRGHSLYRDGTDKAWVRRRLGQFTQSPHRYGRVAKKARSGRAPWLS